MFRYLLPLLLMASPAWAQEEKIATLDSNGRVLSLPLADGYVTVSGHDREFFDAFSTVLSSGKVVLIEMLATEQDLARLDEGADAHSMIYKVSTDAFFGVSSVSERQWAMTKPRYEKAFIGVDLQEASEKINQKMDAFTKEHAGEDTGIEFRIGEISKPTLYRSDATSFRFHATAPAMFTADGATEKTLYLGFGAVVNLDGRVFILAGEVTAPKDAEGFVRERGNFERFVDRVIALNGAKVRL